MRTEPRKVLVVGAGDIACHHLSAAGAAGAAALAATAPTPRRRAAIEAVGARFFEGGLARALDEFSPSHVIVAVPAQSLASVTRELLDRGAKRVLVEKPGALRSDEAREIAELALARRADVRVALNRRWYPSVLAALADIASRGDAIRAVRVDFTERARAIAAARVAPEVKARWAVGNSIHPIDLALHPFSDEAFVSLETLRSGALAEHPAGSRFAGAGRLAGGALFSYSADWEGPGGWSVEWATASRRYLFRPLEIVMAEAHGEAPAPLALPPDPGPKPGFLTQIIEFMDESPSPRLPRFGELARLLQTIERIAGY